MLFFKLRNNNFLIINLILKKQNGNSEKTNKK